MGKWREQTAEPSAPTPRSGGWRERYALSQSVPPEELQRQAMAQPTGIGAALRQAGAACGETTGLPPAQRWIANRLVANTSPEELAARPPEMRAKLQPVQSPPAPETAAQRYGQTIGENAAYGGLTGLMMARLAPVAVGRAAQIAQSWPGASAALNAVLISIRKGHTYRVVVSDLEKKRPIWFGGIDRSEESLKRFMTSSEPPNRPRSGLRSWTCGSPSKPSRKRELPMPPSSMTSSMS